MNTLGPYVGKTSHSIVPTPGSRIFADPSKTERPVASPFALASQRGSHRTDDFVVRLFTFLAAPSISTRLVGKYVVLDSLPTLLHLHAHHSTSASAYINNSFWSMIHHPHSSYTPYKMKHQLLFIILSALLGLGICQPPAVLTSTGCVDPMGLQQCFAEASSAPNNDLNPYVDGNKCTEYIQNYQCYAQHCWNRVSPHQPHQSRVTNMARFTNVNTNCTSRTISPFATSF
jgi:hypothetical protein